MNVTTVHTSFYSKINKFLSLNIETSKLKNTTTTHYKTEMTKLFVFHGISLFAQPCSYIFSLTIISLLMLLLSNEMRYYFILLQNKLLAKASVFVYYMCCYMSAVSMHIKTENTGARLGLHFTWTHSYKTCLLV